jgi:hypothetical protein
MQEKNMKKVQQWASAVVIAMMTSMAAIGAEEPKGPCADEIKKFCAEVKPGGGAIEECLKQHDAELSPACKTHQDAVRKKLDEFTAACGDDVTKHCADVTAGQARVIACLRDKETQVSEGCMTLIGKKRPAKGHGQGPVTK